MVSGTFTRRRRLLTRWSGQQPDKPLSGEDSFGCILDLIPSQFTVVQGGGVKSKHRDAFTAKLLSENVGPPNLERWAVSMSLKIERNLTFLGLLVSGRPRFQRKREVILHSTKNSQPDMICFLCCSSSRFPRPRENPPHYTCKCLMRATRRTRTIPFFLLQF